MMAETAELRIGDQVYTGPRRRAYVAIDER
jgi:hypothetical protein